MQKLTAIISQMGVSANALLNLPGVNGVDVGYKYVKGQRTGEIAIRVLVTRKRKTVPPKERIPAVINGIKTDVIQRKIVPLIVKKAVKNITPVPDAKKYDPVPGGVSIGPERSIGGYVFAGTLGCIVKDNVSKETLLLSNFHVMAVDSGWKKGDFMAQPSLVDGGKPVTDRVGALNNAVLSSRVDGALCTLSGRKADCSIVDIGPVKGVADPALNAPVRKRGRTTLLTYGFVDSINGTVKIDYGDGIGVKTLTNQVGIRPDTAHNTQFSDHGDSGSVVVDAGDNIIGLLFAGSSDGFAYINHISDVLSELNIQVCTTAKPPKKKKKKKDKAKKKGKKKKDKS